LSYGPGVLGARLRGVPLPWILPIPPSDADPGGLPG